MFQLLSSTIPVYWVLVTVVVLIVIFWSLRPKVDESRILRSWMGLKKVEYVSTTTSSNDDNVVWVSLSLTFSLTAPLLGKDFKELEQKVLYYVCLQLADVLGSEGDNFYQALAAWGFSQALGQGYMEGSWQAVKSVSVDAAHSFLAKRSSKSLSMSSA